MTGNILLNGKKRRLDYGIVVSISVNIILESNSSSFKCSQNFANNDSVFEIMVISEFLIGKKSKHYILLPRSSKCFPAVFPLHDQTFFNQSEPLLVLSRSHKLFI